MTRKIYPVLNYLARYSFALMGVGLVTLSSGCSSSPSPTTIPLESLNLHADSCQKLKKTNTSPLIYRCPTATAPVFVTTLKDCSIPEKLTFQTTTRQLFVGMVGMRVVSQEPVPLGSINALQTVVVGAMDAEPVMMSTFTFRHNSCVNDIVVWQGVASTQKASELVEQFTTTSHELTRTLFKDDLTEQNATQDKA